MNRAIIYLRVSTEDQTEESQLEPCKQLCKERNYEVISIFKDHGKSAYHTIKRPSYDTVIDMVYKRKIDHIVVWALDRWTRKGGVELLKEINLLISYGVQLHSCQESFLDEISIPGEIGIHLRNFLIGFLGYNANLEAKHLSDRVKTSTKFQKALKKGKVGRPSLPRGVKEKIRQLLKEGKSYTYIQKNVQYKAKYGVIKSVSRPTISEIKKELVEKGV